MTLTPSTDQKPLLRIEKGTPDEYELAAVTTVLLARLAAGPTHTVARVVRWRRAEWPTGYRVPRSWRAGASATAERAAA